MRKQIALSDTWREHTTAPTRVFDDRSHALRGHAAGDALRPKVVTQSITGGIPTQSVGTISVVTIMGLAVLSESQDHLVPRHPAVIRLRRFDVGKAKPGVQRNMLLLAH